MEEKTKNYQLLVITQNSGIVSHWIYGSTEDLLTKFKTAKFEDNKWITFEKGVFRVDAILGIMEI